MKKFKFKMQAVLRAKEIREDERKRDFAIELQALESEKEKMQVLLQSKEDNLNHLRIVKSKKNVDIKKIFSFEHYLFLLEIKMRDQDIKITAHDLKVKEAGKKLTQAMKERKIMDSLYDKEKLKYYNEMSKTETKIIDEYNVLRESYVKFS